METKAPIYPSIGPRIGIDASSVVGPRTGIGHSTACLLNELANCWPAEWPTPRVLVNSRRHPLPMDDPWLRSGRFDVHHKRWPGKALLRGWQYLNWPPMERMLGPLDVLHAPASYIPPRHSARRIITVYDLYFRQAPLDVEPYGGGYFLKTFERGLPAVDQVITISEFTRGELLHYYPLDPARITVIPLGVDLDRFSPQPDPGDVQQLENLGVKPPYLLCVATIEPRKNLITLIEAYARAREILKAARQQPPPLVIAGQAAWGRPALEARLKEARLGDVVELTGYLPDEALPALYRKAMGFVLPSLHEGFGMPILEAMACGCPVAVSRAAAMPEVAGDAALYLNPRDSQAMARSLVEFISEPHLRASLRSAGFERIKRFTWSGNACSTLDVYLDVMRRGRT